MKEIQRGYKVKIYPNKENQQKLLQTFGSCRFVYNHFLARKKEAYLKDQKNITYNMLSKELTKLRKDTHWMQSVQFQPLQQSLRSLDVAYNRFFRKQARFPKFHKKYGKQSFRKVTGWSVQGNTITIERGLTVRFRGHFPEKRQGTLTISRDSVGDWYASTIGIEKMKQPRLKKRGLGLDFGLGHIVITSDGEKYENPRVLNGLLARVQTASKALSRTKKGSNNRAKRRLELAKTHRKVERVRNNGLHHISKAIVGKNHAMIAVEDLAVQNMMKNQRLSRSIGDASWGGLLEKITYKQQWLGGTVVKIGRFFPSTKTCSSCDFILETLPLSVREWTCPKCEETHDRDVNAAKVILKQAGERLDVERKALAHASARVKLSSAKHGYVQG